MKKDIFHQIAKIAQPSKLVVAIDPKLNIPIVSIQTDKIICDQCGEMTDVWTSYGGYNFCSDECKRTGIRELESERGADRYHDMMDERMERESRDERLNPDRF